MKPKQRKLNGENAGLNKETVKEKTKCAIKNEEEKATPAEIDLDADLSQLEPVTFTTISKQEPETMTNLKWDHKVNLIGEKVCNPMVHCCDTCQKPIIIYGRLLPCKHVFCLSCAKKDEKTCARCKQRVTRIEQTGLSSVFMCTHGGSTYDNKGCRRTYLSQRDLEAHINHRHKPLQNEEKPGEKKLLKSGSSCVTLKSKESRNATTIPAVTTAATIVTTSCSTVAAVSTNASISTTATTNPIGNTNVSNNNDKANVSYRSKSNKKKDSKESSMDKLQLRNNSGEVSGSVQHHSSAGNVQDTSSRQNSQKKSSYKYRHHQQQELQLAKALQRNEESDVPVLSSMVAPPAPFIQQMYQSGSRQRPPAYYGPTVQTHNLITVHLEGEKNEMNRESHSMQMVASSSSGNRPEYGPSFLPPPPTPPPILRNDVFNPTVLPSQQMPFYPNQRPDFPNTSTTQYHLSPHVSSHPSNVNQASTQQQQPFPTMEQHWPRRFF